MPNHPDPSFFQRADAHINLSNEQLSQDIHGRVSASMLYATARFCTSLSARGYQTGADMAAHRAESIDYFVREFLLALEENMAEYIKNFESYMLLAKKIQ
jgi:Protein of unknown function (DUF3144)